MNIKQLVADIAVAYQAHAAAVATANAARKAAVDPLVKELSAAIEAKGLDRASLRESVYAIFGEVYGEPTKKASRGPLAGKLSFEDTNCAARKAADRLLDRLFAFAIEFAFSDKEIAAMDALVKGVFKLKAKNADGELVAVGRKALVRLLNERYDAAEGK
jgi:hypothetical protein